MLPRLEIGEGIYHGISRGGFAEASVTPCETRSPNILLHLVVSRGAAAAKISDTVPGLYRKNYSKNAFHERRRHLISSRADHPASTHSNRNPPHSLITLLTRPLDGIVM